MQRAGFVVVTSVLLVSASHLIARPAQQPNAVRASTSFDSAQLLQDLRTLSADDMEGRQVDTAGGAKARAYVIRRFQESGIAPFGNSYESPFTFAGGRGPTSADRHGVNVIGHIDGTDRSHYIVVSAHYDHIGMRNGQVFNGADDNASGTAALFALAKYFSTTHKLSHSLIFVAFDGEEAGLRGGRAFVRQPPVDAAAITIDLNMDMIGRDPNDKLFVVGTYLQPKLKPVIERVASRAPVKLLIGHDNPAEKDVEDWTRDSDHYAFMEAKIPALYFGVEDFGQHHKATDDYDTMSHDFYVRAVETMILVVREFDGVSSYDAQSFFSSHPF